MNKKLSEMSLEELWQLFPIALKKPDPVWAKQYEDEAKFINEALRSFGSTRISRIGSTAIDGIYAKPIVDILLETSDAENMQSLAGKLTDSGYIIMSESNVPCRISLNKGYTEDGFADKVFHLHLRLFGDNDELYFRDYLNEFEAVRREYESLKLSLAAPYKHDRDGYTVSKTDFVVKYSSLARAYYRDKYGG